MQIEITGIGSEFQGVGRAEDGRVCFVPGALPGETVDVSAVKNAERFMECRLDRIIAPSPERIGSIGRNNRHPQSIGSHHSIGRG